MAKKKEKPSLRELAYPAAGVAATLPLALAEESPRASSLSAVGEGGNWPKHFKGEARKTQAVISKLKSMGRKAGVQYRELTDVAATSMAQPERVFMPKGGREYIPEAGLISPERVAVLTEQAKGKPKFTGRAISKIRSIARYSPLLATGAIAGGIAASRIPHKKTRKGIGKALQVGAVVPAAAGALEVGKSVATAGKAAIKLRQAGTPLSRLLTTGAARLSIGPLKRGLLFGLPAAGMYIAGKKLQKQAAIKDIPKTLWQTFKGIAFRGLTKETGRSAAREVSRAARGSARQKEIASILGGKMKEGDVLLTGSVSRYPMSSIMKIVQGTSKGHAAVVGRGKKSIIHHLGGDKLEILRGKNMKKFLAQERFDIYRPKAGVRKEFGKLEALARKRNVPYSVAKGAVGAFSDYLPVGLRRPAQAIASKVKKVCDPRTRNCSTIVTQDFLPGMKLKGTRPEFATPVDIKRSPSLSFVGSVEMPTGSKVTPHTVAQQLASKVIKPTTKYVLPGAALYAGGKKIKEKLEKK